MRRRSNIPLSFLLLLALAACGAPEPPSVDTMLDDLREALATRDREVVEPVLERIGEAGREHPEVVIPALVERLREERAHGPVQVVYFEVDYADSPLSGAEQRADLRQMIETMARRRQIQFPNANAHFKNLGIDGDRVGRIVMRTARFDLPPEAERQRLEAWIRVMTDPGSVALWLVVEPPAPGQEPPSLWEGDRASYDAFVEEHETVLEEGLEEGRLVQSGTERFRLCLVAPEAKGAPLRHVVLLRPRARPETFDADDLALSGYGDAAEGKNVLELTLRQREGPFHDWLERHAGRRMALVVNGRAELVMPVPPADVELPLRIAVGPLDDDFNQAWVKGILRAVGPGWIRHPITATLVEDDPNVLATPAARALAAVGMPALESVQALQSEAGALGRRARWISEQIVKTQTGTGTGTDRP